MLAQRFRLGRLRSGLLCLGDFRCFCGHLRCLRDGRIGRCHRMRRRLRSRTVLRLLRSTFLRHFSSSTALRHSRIRFSGRPRQLRNRLPHTPCGIARGRAISPMQHLRNRPRRRIGHRFLRGPARMPARAPQPRFRSGAPRKACAVFERQVALDRRHGTGGLPAVGPGGEPSQHGLHIIQCHS